MKHRVELRTRADKRFAYSGQALLVTNIDGIITGSETEGFYFENTRLLSRHELTSNGQPLTPVVASPVEGDGFLAYAEVPEGPTVSPNTVYVQIARFLSDGLWEKLRIENYSQQDSALFDLEVHLAADFADTMETEQGQRQQTADVETTWDQQRQELRFRYCHPNLNRAVAIQIQQTPVPVRYENGALVFSLEVPPHQPVEIHLAVEPIFENRRYQPAKRAFDQAATPLDHVRQQLRDEAPTLTATNTTVSRAWQTAIGDLATLPLGLDAGPAVPIAGVPIYQHFFGRDTLTIAWQALLAMPTMMRDTLRANAVWQGTTIDDWRDEEPGKLIHQVRSGPLSVLGVNPLARYYGDYATPQDFLIMLGQYLLWTNDRATVRALLPTARKAIDWLDRYGDIDGDGFLEYVTRSENGVKNQGWKDAPDGIVDEQGELVENPIATCEIQAYWYAGLQQAAVAFFAAGDRGYALDLLRKAHQLKQRFDEAFWMEDAGFYALGLGPDKDQIRSITSNPGHLLATGIVPREKGKRVVERLMAPDLFSGWGIRTLSSENPSYNPFSYHRGSVWPVENGTFALGFGRYGYFEELHRLAEAIFAATDLFNANRLPEAIGGHPRNPDHPHPGIYPQSNAPQGWSASMIVLLIQSLLGMRPVAPLNLLLVDPHLPDWLPDLRIEGIQVGQARVDMEFRRKPDGKTAYQVTRRAGRIRVLRQPAPDAPDTSLRGRALAAVSSLVRS